MLHAIQPQWDGARNLADLGGLPLRGGGRTRQGVIFRSAASEWLTTEGWRSASAAGLSRVVDLRNAAERVKRSDHPRVAESATYGIEMVNTPTEDPDNPTFLAECGPWLDHPRSWTPNMTLFPEKLSRVFEAIAEAPGPVLVHCAKGRDRTGMICSLLLALAGADAATICHSYEAGFRGAALSKAQEWAYDSDTETWSLKAAQTLTPTLLAAAIADRMPALREWCANTDAARYLQECGIEQEQLVRLQSLLRP